MKCSTIITSVFQTILNAYEFGMEMQAGGRKDNVHTKATVSIPSFNAALCATASTP